MWDILFGKLFSGLPKDIIADFFRAALLEECFKFLGFLRAKNKYHLSRKIDYIMTAGLIGLVYGVVEKAVLDSIGGVVVGLAIPMHIIWQFNQGGHYYEYEKLKKAGNAEAARKEWFLAVPFIFLLHGAWDSALDISLYLVNKNSMPLEALGGVLFFGLVAAGLWYCIRTVRKVVRIAKNSGSESFE